MPRRWVRGTSRCLRPTAWDSSTWPGSWRGRIWRLAPLSSFPHRAPAAARGLPGPRHRRVLQPGKQCARPAVAVAVPGPVAGSGCYHSRIATDSDRFAGPGAKRTGRASRRGIGLDAAGPVSVRIVPAPHRNCRRRYGGCGAGRHAGPACLLSAALRSAALVHGHSARRGSNPCRRLDSGCSQSVGHGPHARRESARLAAATAPAGAIPGGPAACLCAGSGTRCAFPVRLRANPAVRDASGAARRRSCASRGRPANEVLP